MSTRQTKRLGVTKDIQVALTPSQRGMLETLARDKYKCPQSKSHVIRMMIEGEYKTWIENAAGTEGRTEVPEALQG